MITFEKLFETMRQKMFQRIGCASNAGLTVKPFAA